ncbi:hypothetical protein ACH5RR_022675 [Cinchona calisaya]|uniref:2-C-methyl-D-erythritol 4-phosphate cytidylyltransferase n=1 Tax=Cinchona calisaya TaxID=153742 RepID=A0ABD2Z8G9_9GENT
MSICDLHCSFFTFCGIPEVKEIVVVCDPSYQDIFEDAKQKIHIGLKFALPGKERQDSVYSGLQAVDSSAELVCIHDSARPLVLAEDVGKADSKYFVVRTLDRKTLQEMQTPQVTTPDDLLLAERILNPTSPETS